MNRIVDGRWWSVCAFLWVLNGAATAAEPFTDKVQPFLKTYCVGCHNKDKASAELDLTKFNTTAQLVQDFRAWEHVLTFTQKEEMPPKKAKQPTVKERSEFLTTLEQVLLAEAKKFAGDPGVVPPRRLSNAEYDNTIVDLTGVDIRPAKAFPIDPASGEGFNNTGEALTMSPALFKKYYAAAEFVADHAVLTTKGLTFAPHMAVTFADRQKYVESAVIRFYEQHTVNYEAYFMALWLHQRQKAILTEQAQQKHLSLKYLQALDTALNGKGGESFALEWVRGRWQTILGQADMGKAVGEMRTLATEIQQLSKILCPKETEAIVANAGNGPIEHLARRRRTADTRDQFNTATLENLKLEQEYKNIADQETIKVVLHLGAVGTTKAEGDIFVKGIFTTNSATTDGQKFWSLRRLLMEFAPNQYAKLEKSFGKGPKADADVLVLTAPTTLELTIPVKAFSFKDKKANVTFVTTIEPNRLAPCVAAVQLLDRQPKDDDSPFKRAIIDPKHPAAKEYAESAAAYCKLFPSRFYYVDSTRGLSAGFHLIEGFFRDDRPLYHSVLSDAEQQELDALWKELYFVTGIWEKMLRGFVFFERSERNFMKHRDFDAFKEEDPDLVKDEVLVKFKETYLNRAGVKLKGDELAAHPISVFFDDVRNGLKSRTATLKQAEPQYLKDLHAFAAKAYRRPLTTAETQKFDKFYHELASNPEHGTEQAVRASLVRVLVSPHFCFHMHATPAGETVVPLDDLQLASRLSYFIWGSLPDAELLALAKQGKLRDETILRQQVQRMIRDPKVSRFAQEFFGQWLGYRDFMTQEAVNRQVFPTFDDGLKQAMFEEPTRLATYLIRENKPITQLLNGKTTFVNKKLATHYGLSFKGQGDEWEMVDGLHAQGRAGLLGMAVVLTKNSQPQRTSPVKRGFWVVHKLLGEHIPPPPPDVAVLPAKETDTNGKTIRQLLALHTADTRCAQCHNRFDPVGLAMEGFDPIGKSRSKDLAGRPIDNVVKLEGAKEAKGIPEFANYLATHRKTDFTKTLSHKFLGYALGRSLQLSDQPLLTQMQTALDAKDQLSALFELVVLSPQFRTQRGRDFTPTKFQPVSTGDEKK